MHHGVFTVTGCFPGTIEKDSLYVSFNFPLKKMDLVVIIDHLSLIIINNERAKLDQIWAYKGK
ncbi:MAG: hypothetical protein Ct9H300mP6_05010 [Gammaproteobacteria bacterium]|nr:MAG: hypothetical protein Ct9H300mP6_05010 [Gammaproteobacteria bacterium]